MIDIVIFCALLGAIAQLLLKKGMMNFESIFKIPNIYLMIGVILYGTAFLLYNYTLQYEELSVLYPIIALSYIFVLFLSVIFLNEKVTLINWIGSGLIMAGVWLIVI